MKNAIIFTLFLLIFSSCKKECANPGYGEISWVNTLNQSVIVTDANGQEVFTIPPKTTKTDIVTPGCYSYSFGSICAVECKIVTKKYE